MVEVAVASLCIGGVDAQLSEGGGQVPRAAPPAQRGGSWVAGLVLVKRRGQRGGEVETGQVRQRAASVEGGRDAVSRRGRLLRGRKDTERKQQQRFTFFQILKHLDAVGYNLLVSATQSYRAL